MFPKRAILEVDPSIVENNLMITDPHDDELRHLFPAAKDEAPSKLVKPIPGFCIKTRSTEGEKIFINICQTDAIPEPDDISEAELLEMLNSETPNYRIGMSIGNDRPVTDNSGKPALAYDIAIHPAFFIKIEGNLFFKQFFLNAVFEAIQDKYKITINLDDCTMLKNRKVMGTLQLHRIRQGEVEKKMNKGRKLIEEIDEPVIPMTVEEKKVPFYRLVKDTDEHGDILVGEFYIPDITSVNDVTLDIGEDRIVLESRKRNYLVDIFVPCALNQDSTGAQFNTISRILTVTMPIMQGV